MKRPTRTAILCMPGDNSLRPGAAGSPLLRLSRWTLAAALAVAAHAAFAATPGIDAPPLPQPPRPVVVPAFAQQQLANGLTVVTAPRHDTPVVTIALLVRAGPELDPAGRSGTAAMTSGLLTKGARRGRHMVSATDIAQQAEALGASLDTATGWRSSTVTMTVTRPKLEAAAALLADVVRQPTLAAEELERARAQSLDGLRVTMGDPAAVAGMAARRVFWGDSAYGKAATLQSLKRISRADVQAFHAAVYRPERAVLVFAGDIEPTLAQALARRLFGSWRGAGKASAPAQPAAAKPLPEALALIDMPGSGQSGVVVAVPFVAANAADRRAGQVANAVLGGGYSARLNQEVRIKRGLSYGAFSEAETHPGSGMAVASTQTNHPNAAQVLQLMRGEVERMAAAPPAADELAARQATLIGGFARRLETTGGLASLVIAQLAQGRPLEDLRHTVEEISAVTPEQVQGFAREHWQAGGVRGVIAGDLKAGGEGIGNLPGPSLRVPVEALDLAQPGLGAK